MIARMPVERLGAIQDTKEIEFLRDVVDGLSQPRKQLPSRYFYDAVGSALFEAITALDAYGLTRADERLLRTHAGAIVKMAGNHARVVELGCGSGRKTRWILEALPSTTYHPIDVSAAALTQCRAELSQYARVVPFTGTFLDGLSEAAANRGDEPLLVLFLGSTIGNFSAADGVEFLTDVRAHLRPGDSMLIGFDLVKEHSVLLEAYNDPAGVTAAFNLNLLSRINRELHGNFKIRQFEHHVKYNDQLQRIEMHLASTVQQTASIGVAGLTFEFEAGETIWTESSHKYQKVQLSELARTCGFREAGCWVDREWPFAESIWLVD